MELVDLSLRRVRSRARAEERLEALKDPTRLLITASHSKHSIHNAAATHSNIHVRWNEVINHGEAIPSTCAGAERGGIIHDRERDPGMSGGGWRGWGGRRCDRRVMGGGEERWWVCQEQQMVANDGKLQRRPPAGPWSGLAHQGRGGGPGGMKTHMCVRVSKAQQQ